MIRFAFGIAFCLAPLAFAQVVQSQVVERPFSTKPIPDWVEVTELNLEARETDGSGVNEPKAGIYYRLVEEQHHAELGHHFYHYADEFLTSGGIQENGELRIEYDPAYQEVDVHFIRILREDDVSIDVLESSAFRLTKPDEDLADGLYDGHSRLLFLIRDLRPGDILHYAYTIRGDLPALRGYFTGSVPLGWSASVGRLNYRLVKSLDRPIFYRNHLTDIRCEKEMVGANLESWTWSGTNFSPHLPESSAPPWFSQYPWVQLSQFADWQEVADWGRQYYDFKQEPLGDELTAAIELIRSQSSSIEDQIVQTIRFVQDEIRYLGLVEGDQAYCPVSPNLVAARRFGDCKDKSTLLLRLLQELGVSSDPVYVSSRRGRGVENWHPTPTAFDHVVLRISLPNGNVLWCDPTVSHQGGRVESLPFSNPGKGLIVREGTTALIDLPETDHDRDYFEVRETIKMGDVGEPTQMIVESLYYGAEADRVRFYFDTTEPQSAEQHYLNYYQENHPGIVMIEPIQMTDDRDANQIVVTEAYHLFDPWEATGDSDGYYSATFSHQPIRDLLSQPENLSRQTPWAIPSPVRRVIRQTIEVPSLKQIADDDWYFEDETHFIEGPGLEYRRQIVWDADAEVLTASSEMVVLEDSLPPSDLSTWVEKTDQIYLLSETEIWRYLSAEDTDTSSSETDSDNLEDFIWSAILAISSLVFLGMGLLAGYLIGRNRKPKASARHAAGPPPLG